MPCKWGCATISCRDWPAAQAKPPAHRAQNPLRPRERGYGALEPESERVRLFINLVRDSISVITVMKPIVSLTRSLRHVLNSIPTRQCAVVSKLLSLSHSTSLMPSARVTYDITQQTADYQRQVISKEVNNIIKQVTNIKISPLTWTWQRCWLISLSWSSFRLLRTNVFCTLWPRSECVKMDSVLMSSCFWVHAMAQIQTHHLYYSLLIIAS